jgi:hypothetical protein
MVNEYTYLSLFLDDLSKTVPLSAFQRAFGTPHQTIKARLEPLVRKGVLKTRKEGRLLLYSVDREHPLLLDCLALCEKERFLDFIAARPLFKRIVEVVKPSFRRGSLILFGSAVLGDRFNDIDLLLLEGNDEAALALQGITRTYGHEPHLLRTSSEELTSIFLKEVRSKHIILHDHDAATRTLYGEELAVVREA